MSQTSEIFVFRVMFFRPAFQFEHSTNATDMLKLSSGIWKFFFGKQSTRGKQKKKKNNKKEKKRQNKSNTHEKRSVN